MAKNTIISHNAAKIRTDKIEKNDTTKDSQTPPVISEHKKTKHIVSVLLVFVLIASVFYIQSLNNNTQAMLKTYRLESNNKNYRDSFSVQDTIIIDLAFYQSNVKNYRIEILKDGSSTAPFKIEVPAAEEGQNRTIAIPKQLLSAGTVTLTLKDAETSKTFQEKKITITN